MKYKLRVGEGINISRDEEEIDVVIGDIRGTSLDREVSFEVRRTSGRDYRSVHVSSLFVLRDDIHLKFCCCGGGRRVLLCCIAPKSYKIHSEKYYGN